MIVDRTMFRQQWPESLSCDRGALWVPEQAIGGAPAQWFVQTPRLKFDYDQYWQWCDHNLQGPVRCYASGDWEWWGFVHKKDITVWLLKWA